ncbi:MAG: hypothetical protein WD715_10080 [Dongiaceae bacterium]
MSPVDRLFVLDPLPVGKGGHHQHFIDGIRRDAGRWCRGIHFLVARKREGGPPPEPPFHEVFRHYLYKQLSTDARTGPANDFETGSEAYRRDLAALTAMAPGPGDLILLPSASIRTLGGLAKWRIDVASPTPVAALFHHAIPFHLTFEPGSVGHAIARTTSGLLRTGEECGPVLLGSTNAVLAERLGAAMERPVRVLPLPHWYDLDAPSAEPVVLPSTSDRAPVGFVGSLRREKGGERIPGIVGAGAGLPLRWIAQAHAPDPGLLEPLRALEQAGRVELIARELSEGEFLRLMHDLALIVLPYERVRYHARVSGPFAFAAAFGRPCVVPDGTWMASQIETGKAAGIAYRGDAPAAIAAAIGTALERLPELTRQAEKLAVRWRKGESGMALLEAIMLWATRDTDR